MTGIYKIICTATNEVYIGQSVEIKRRWATHKRELKNNIHYNKHMQSTYNKYGEQTFVYEILELCPASKLDEREKFYIKLFDSRNHGFNQDIGGNDIRGENNPMYGIKGANAPRFKDYILKLAPNGEIVDRYESTIDAAKSVNGQAAHINSCLKTWQGIKHCNTYRFIHKGYQWIYEKDYQRIKIKWDFSSPIKSEEQFLKLKLDEGALNSDI